MTTKLIIKVPLNAHKSVRIDITWRNGVRSTAGSHVTLDAGDEREFYVYAGQDLRLSEVTKGLGAKEHKIAEDKLARQFLD